VKEEPVNAPDSMHVNSESVSNEIAENDAQFEKLLNKVSEHNEEL
jgi:hypothetical protein